MLRICAKSGTAAGCISALLCMMLLPGCAEWAPRVLEADEVALGEVFSIGTVVAQTTDDQMFDEDIQRVAVLITDVGAASFAQALETAEDRLAKRGWSTTFKNADSMGMRSDKWERTNLVARRFAGADSFFLEVQQQLEKELKSDPSKWDKYLLVHVSKASE
jgi:hypothetical protein